MLALTSIAMNLSILRIP
ncbi:hypothetical protein GQ607_004114 [Colletotrichum asianum]|uniref:Uncharacterized protein n=1 Tax=Colletotrichum asianum TaxID=702518 RepID=A0A8H3ZV42_9PEZI|nr:hypothetical protein GQ607_004114 [Colletotrichum asianum]